MKLGIVRYTLLMALAFVACVISGCSKAPSPQLQETQQTAAKPAPSVPKISVSPAVVAKSKAPKPGPKAATKKVAESFGKGKASIPTKGKAHPGGLSHSFWTEELDVDGSGNPVQVDEVWDSRHKVLYLSNDRSFSCGNGEDGTGSTLMAVYGKGNPLHKPAGSGWWMTELDAGGCGVQDAGLYGCHFDANGNNTDCGSGTIQPDADDVVIIPLPSTQGPSGGASASPTTPSSPATPAAPSSSSPPAAPAGGNANQPSPTQ